MPDRVGSSPWSAVGRWLKRITAGLCWLYAVLVVGFALVRIIWPALPPPLALVNSFTPWLYAGLPVVLLIGLILRSRPALLAGAVLGALFVGQYGARFLPNPGWVCPAERTLRVMTFNLGLGLSQPEALAVTIREQGADIVAVQEATEDTARLFGLELGPVYPYSVLSSGASKTGLYSRHPILEQAWIAPAGGGRPSLEAQVAWGDAMVTVYVVHPLPPGLAWYRDTGIPIGLDDGGPQRQVEEIARRAAARDGLVLVMGDFNMSDHTPAYAHTTEVLHDTYREAGWGFGFTFPNGWRVRGVQVPGPLTRFDHVLHSDGFCAQWARVGCEGGSDHCYVLAQLAQGK